MTATYTSQTNQSKSATRAAATAGKSPCGCGGAGTSDCGCGCKHACGEPCCSEVCFLRPNYFCGHLLTDDDLTSGQRYFREKNKLYHRTLHGCGIVCGLGLRRDLNCPSNILVGDGFAIDACGNDLVVCEQESFNVIAALRQKGYLVSENNDPCTDNMEDDCGSTRCFWIAARYAETASDFESPLQSACTPGPTACEPTRIQETVQFEVLDEAPQHKSPLEQLIARMECCFLLLTEGTFANTVKAYQSDLSALLNSGDASPNTDYRAIFCQLKAYFLQHIRRCPDPYDALLESEVVALPSPDPNSNIKPSNALCSLFGLVWRYISDCITGVLVFPCPAPKTTGEVILGTIEITNGKLARVCHCSRSYVWSAANFWQVLVAYLVEAKGCERSSYEETGLQADRPAGPQNDPAKPATGHCCPEIDLNCSTFFQLYLADQKSPQKAMMETLGILTGLVSAAKTTFNVFDPNVVPYSAFIGLDPDTASKLAKSVNVNLQVVQEAPVQTPLSAYAGIFSRALLRPNDTMIVSTSTDDKQKETVVPLSITPTSLLLDIGHLSSQVGDSQRSVGATNKQVQDVSSTAAKASDLAAANRQLENLAATSAKSSDLFAINSQLQQLSSVTAKASDLVAANQQIEQLTAALAEKDKTIASVHDLITQLSTRVAALEKPSEGAQGD